MLPMMGLVSPFRGGGKNANKSWWLSSKVLPFCVEKPERFYRLSERLLIFTPDLLRKSAP